MAFTGSPVFQMISGSIMRVTGISLAAGAAGGFALDSFVGALPAGVVKLPAEFAPKPYALPDGSTVDLVEAIDVAAKPTTTGAVVVAVPVHSSKTGGTPQTWVGSLSNPSAGPTQTLEIYIRFNQ